MLRAPRRSAAGHLRLGAHVWERTDGSEVDHLIRRFGLSALSQLASERSTASNER